MRPPFGNSGWQYDLYPTLIRADAIGGTFDDDGWIRQCDELAGDRLIAEAIKAMAAP